MDTQPGLGHRTLILIVVAVVLLGVLLVILDWGQVGKVLLQANWRLLPLALLFSAISLSCLGISYALVLRVFGIDIGFRELFEVGLISNILNHLLPTGGAAGYSLGLALARRRGYSLSDVIGASLLHSFFSSVVMLVILPAGLLYLAIVHPLPPQAARGIAIVGTILIALTVFVTALILRHALRDRVLSLVSGAWMRLRKRDIRPALKRFDLTMTQGIAAMRAAPLVAWSVVALSIADWAATLVAMHFCFRALGPAPSPGVLITGFIIGMAVGMVSLVPGGLGVQEGSMAGIYHLLGMSLEQAALATILFRAIYYLVPFVLTLPLYWRLVRSSAAIGREPAQDG